MSGEQQDRVQYDANVDDLDPRLWPRVIERLLAAGADDAWITPIVMKKGRPAFTVSALCTAELAASIRRIFFVETSTIGVRETVVRKFVLDRRFSTVEVDGQTIGVKTSFDGDDMVNVSIEWDDVDAAATALDRPAKEILAQATALAHQA